MTYPPGSLLTALADAMDRTAEDERCRRSLEAYCRRSWSGFQAPWHIKKLIAALEAVERGEITRLMVFMPPRHGKSFVASQMFPAWYLGHHPERSIITASYAQDLADGFGRKVRTALQDPMHMATFPNCRVKSESAAAKRLDLEAFLDEEGNRQNGGAYYAVGRGGAMTGRGAHLLLVDDPIKDRKEADSALVRQGLKDWYGDVAYTRLMGESSAVVIIQTRWHQDDLAGWLLEEHADEGWTVISLPAIAEEDEEFRKEGEALWPEAFPLSILRVMRRQLGEASWVSLYGQSPAAAEGSLFKRHWWQRYEERPTKFLRIVQSWDTAHKLKTENDPSACTTWGETANGYYLLHVFCERLAFPDLLTKAKALAEEWGPNAVLVEGKASGTSLVQSLQRETRLPVIEITPDGDKVARANVVTPLIESGRVFLPAIAPWVADFETELASFPAAKHDDRVDSTTQALTWMSAGPKKSVGYLNHIEAEIARIRAEQKAKENPA